MQKFSGSAPRPRAYAAGVGLQWAGVPHRPDVGEIIALCVLVFPFKVISLYFKCIGLTLWLPL